MYNALNATTIGRAGALGILKINTKKRLTKVNKTNILINKLPDEIYILIMKFASDYLYEIPRWNPTINRWRSHCNIKCSNCNRKNVALSHICKSCNQDCGPVCCNTLICWDCAH